MSCTRMAKEHLGAERVARPTSYSDEAILILYSSLKLVQNRWSDNPRGKICIGVTCFRMGVNSYDSTLKELFVNLMD